MTDTGREASPLGAHNAKASAPASSATGDARAAAFVSRAVSSALRNLTSAPGAFSLNDVFTPFKIAGRSYNTVIMSQVLDDLISMGMASRRRDLYKTVLTSSEGAAIASCAPLMSVFVTRGLQRLQSKVPPPLPEAFCMKAMEWMERNQARLKEGSGQDGLLEVVATLSEPEVKHPPVKEPPPSTPGSASSANRDKARLALQSANPYWSRMDVRTEGDVIIVTVPIVSSVVPGWEVELRVTVSGGACTDFAWGEVPDHGDTEDVSSRSLADEVKRMKSRIVEKISKSPLMKAMEDPPSLKAVLDDDQVPEEVTPEQPRVDVDPGMVRAEVEGTKGEVESTEAEAPPSAPVDAAPPSVQPWQTALTDDQRQRLYTAQEAVLRLMHDKALSRKDIFAGLQSGAWQETFCVKLEKAGIVRRIGERFQTRWVIPDEVQNLPSVEKLIALVLDEQEYADYLVRIQGKPPTPSLGETGETLAPGPRDQPSEPGETREASDEPVVPDLTMEERVLALEDCVAESNRVNLEVVQQLNAVILKWKNLETRVRELELMVGPSK